MDRIYSINIIDVCLHNGVTYWAEWYRHLGLVVFGGDWHKVPDLESHTMPEPDDCQAWAEMHLGYDEAWKQESDAKARKTIVVKAPKVITPRFTPVLQPVNAFTPDKPQVAAIRAMILAKKLQPTNV